MNELLHNVMVSAYLDRVCDQVRCREVHADIREELLSHIADGVEALAASGLAESDAVGRALNQMGDPDVVGRQLHELHRPRIDWWLLGTMATLVLVGIWVMYAASVSDSVYTWSGNVFQRQLLWSGIGLGVGGAALFCDYRRLQRLSWPMFGAVLLLTAATADLRTAVGGLRIFVDLSPLCYAPALAGIFAAWDWGAPKSLWKALAVITLPCLIYLHVGTYFALFTYLLLSGVLVMASRPRRAQLMVLTGAGGAAAAILVYTGLLKPYIWQRLHIWPQAYRDPTGAGFQLSQAHTAFTHAGWWGQGALASFKDLPGADTEFVFPYLVYTLGWIAGAVVCVLALLFTSRLIRVSRGVREPFGRFLVLSIGTVFLLQFGWNLPMTVGILPTVGVELPFISGGSQQAMYLALVGLTLSVFRRKTTTAKI